MVWGSLVATAVIMKRGARWTGQILISMFHFALIVHSAHMVHGFSKSTDLNCKLCGKVHHFSRKPNEKSISEREKTTKNEKIAKSDQKVAWHTPSKISTLRTANRSTCLGQRFGPHFLHTLPALFAKSSVFTWDVFTFSCSKVKTSHVKTLLFAKSTGMVCKNWGQVDVQGFGEALGTSGEAPGDSLEAQK